MTALHGQQGAVLAVCERCPTEVSAADALVLVPLMDEHADTTGHRLWAVSLTTNDERR